VIDLEYIRERVRGVGPLQLPSIRPICIMIYRKRQYTPRVSKPTVKLFVKPSVFDGDISLWAKGSLLQDVIAPFAARLSTERARYLSGCTCSWTSLIGGIVSQPLTSPGDADVQP
jgi:hypothetical protein